MARDRKAERALCSMGWKVLTVWECETKKQSELVIRLFAELPPL